MAANPQANGAQDDDLASRLSSLCDAFLKHTRENAVDQATAELQQLRTTVLMEGIPTTEPNIPRKSGKDEEQAGMVHPTIRGKVWKTVLGVSRVDVQLYKDYVALGPNNRHLDDDPKQPTLYEKVRGDTFRTFPEEKTFQDRVQEQALVRVLNSFSHHMTGQLSYVQGMNALAAGVLYCMPEVDAYFALVEIITQRMHLYWVKDMVGAHAGCELVAFVLEEVDPELYQHMRANGMKQARVYAYPQLSSLSSACRPFTEVLKLWDFLMAFGPHLNVLCVAAQIILIRKKLLATTDLNQYLNYRKWPHLRADAVISLAMSLLPRIKTDTWHYICVHAVDPRVAGALVGREDIKFSPIQVPTSVPKSVKAKDKAPSSK